MSDTPYKASLRQQRIDSVVDSVTEVIADLIVYRIFRKKPAELKFDVSNETFLQMKMATANEWLALVEARDKAKLKYTNTMRIGYLISFLYAVFALVVWQGGGLPLILVILFITAYKASKHKMAFKRQFSDTLLPSLLRNLEGFEYKPDAIIPLESVEASQIIPDHNDHLTRQEDYLRKEHNGVVTELVECELARWRTDSKGNRRRSEVFRGLLLRMELPHRINSRVILHANWGNFFSLLQKKPMQKNQKVELDIHNPLGSKFDIYAEDPAIAKLVLTSEFLDAYKNFTDKLDVAQPEFSLYEDKCVLLLHRPEDMFAAPPLHGDITVESVLMPILKEIKMVEELTTIARKAGGS